MPGQRQKRRGFKTLRLPKALRFLQPAHAAVKQTFCRKLPDAQEGRPRLAALPGTRGLRSGGERSHGSGHRRPAGPGRAGPTTTGGRRDTGWRAGEARRAAGKQAPSSPARAQPARQLSSSGAARGNGERPLPVERSGSACAKSPTEGADATFRGGFVARQGGKVPPLPRRPPAPGELRRVSGGARRSPPEAAVRGLQGEGRVLPPPRGSL